MREAESARAYLVERKLDGEMADAFQLGYAPNRWDACVRWARKHKVRYEVMEAAGMVLRSDRPDSRTPLYDRFRDRIMFPIHDEQGRVVGFSGRTMSDGPRTAKYVNSPETELFHKSRILYAMDKARRPIVEGREALICEGQIDVIRCHQSGFTMAVASQGTAFTEDQARILRRYADSVCIAFDPDKAGQDASVKAASVFIEAGLAVRVVALPDGDDPDTLLLREGADAFRKLIDQASSVVGFQIDVLSGREDPDSEVGAMRIARDVLSVVRKSPNAVQRARMIQEAAESLRLPIAALEKELAFLERRGSFEGRSLETQATEHASNAPRMAEERMLCEHLFLAKGAAAVLETVRKYLPLDLLGDDASRTLVSVALEAGKDGDPQDLLRDRDPTGELQRLAAETAMAPQKISGREFSGEDVLQDIVLRLWRRRLRAERDALGDTDRERRAQLTYDLDALKRWDTGVAVIELMLEVD